MFEAPRLGIILAEVLARSMRDCINFRLSVLIRYLYFLLLPVSCYFHYAYCLVYFIFSPLTGIIYVGWFGPLWRSCSAWLHFHLCWEACDSLLLSFTAVSPDVIHATTSHEHMRPPLCPFTFLATFVLRAYIYILPCTPRRALLFTQHFRAETSIHEHGSLVRHSHSRSHHLRGTLKHGLAHSIPLESRGLEPHVAFLHPIWTFFFSYSSTFAMWF